jgi:CSLREA domain-containing protein
MKHYFTQSQPFSNITLTLIIIFVVSCFQIANAQKLLFPDEFQRLPESDPGAEITAKVLPNSNNKIFYGTIGSDNVVWVNGEPEKLDFPGKILSANADFTYVKGVISENESYYVFKDWEYTYININYAPGFSNLKVVYFSDDGSLIIGTAKKSDGTNSKDRAVKITNGNWQILGDDPPLDEWAWSRVRAVRGENGSIIIGDKAVESSGQGFRLENGSFQYFSYKALVYVDAVSPDGNVITGAVADPDLNNYIAYKWRNGSLTPLPELGGNYSYHYASSANNGGDIVTGYAEFYDGTNYGFEAFIWSQEGGIRKFSEYISAEYGIDFPGKYVRSAILSEDESYFSGTIQYADNVQRPYILLLNETDDRIVVNSTADRPLNVENSTDCNTGEQIEIDGKMVAECTLRAAIQAAINRFKEETGQSGKISFNIPGTDAHIVAVNSPLPDITAPIEIDGSDEISNTGLPLIYIDGQSAGGGVNGFNIINDSITLKKLAIYGFDGHGIYVADVEDIRLEGLIVGSDGNGTENIGNGNDGIHISGNAKIKVGGELMETSPLASDSFGTTVAVLGNNGNGIAVVGTEAENLKSGNTTPFKFQTEEEMEKVFNNLTVGMIYTGDNFTKSIENLGAGVFLKGKNIIFDNSAFGASGGPAMEVVASESVHVMQTSFGKKKDKISESGDVVNQKSGNIQKSINIQPFIKVLSSRGIMIGSTDASQNPIEAIGSKGFFAEIEDSEDVKVANVISGAVKNLEGISKELAEQMKNAIGGIRVENSNRVNIGDKNVPTIITNSGTPGDSSAIGILISGVGTKLLKIANTIVGKLGNMEGSGIAGDGIRIEDGVSEFSIGGEDEDEKVVVAGNGGYGVHLVNNNNNSIGGISGRLPSVITNLFTDYSEPGVIESISPNIAGALKIADSDNMILKKLSIGPTEGHGIEITGKSSTGISLIQSSIGAIGNQLIESIGQIAGPMKDGIHISEASDIQIGSDISEELVRILGSGGHGLSVNMSKGIKMSQLNIGDLIAEQINEQFSEALLKASNKQGGIFVNFSDSIEIIKSRINNNGAGNNGDGIRIENGVSNLKIGGEEEDEKVVVAGNSGYGVHLLNNNNNSIGGISGRLPSVIANLFTDYSKPGVIESMSPNIAGALKIADSDNMILKKLSIGPTKGHGIEITGKSSTGISLIQSSIGAIGNQLIESIGQIAGPLGDGIHISEASDIQIGSDISEELVRILGSGGHGLSVNMSKGVKMNQLNIGHLIAEQINEQFSEALQKAANKQGGIFINSSDSIDIMKSKISNNGTPGFGPIGGLVAKLSGTIQIHSSTFGEKVDSVTHTGNHGAAIITEQVKKISLSASKVAGNMIGILASDSNIEMEGNTIEEQKGGEGEPGHGVQVKGGFLNASKNTIKNNSGTGVVLDDVFAAVVRINNIYSNVAGAMISKLGETKSAGENGSIVYAGENWWGDASGPGGDGPGTGNAVSGDLDYSNWLNAPFGVTVVPKEHLISLTGDQEYILPVAFANHQDVSDQLNVTISDSLGWYSGSNSFSVSVENFEYSNESLSFNPAGSQSNINVVRIEAVSQNNPDLTSEVKIYFVPPANILNLENPSLVETNILDTESGPFQIGDEIIIGHGLANEETGTIADFGSIILENPLRFSHAPGERIFTLSNLYTSVNEIAVEIPNSQKTVLGNNYPNPFSDKTHIPFEIDYPTLLEITVLDKLGRTVQKLTNEKFPAGKHEVTFEGNDFPAGMYFYQIKGNNIFETRKMIISR